MVHDVSKKLHEITTAFVNIEILFTQRAQEVKLEDRKFLNLIFKPQNFFVINKLI